MNNANIPSDCDTKRVSAERLDVIRGHAQCDDMGNRHTRCERHAGHVGGHHALVGVRKPCHVRWPNDGIWALYPRKRATARRRENQAKPRALYCTFCKKPISEHDDERCTETARRRDDQAKGRGGKP